MSFNAGDVVGKTLTAVMPVPIKRLPGDAAPVVYTVPPGQPVGVVHSYISVGEAGNKKINWMLKDASGRNYYAEHLEGRYSTKGLKDQGLLTTKEKTEAEAQKDEPITKFIERNITKIAIIAGAAIVFKSVIPSLLKSRK